MCTADAACMYARARARVYMRQQSVALHAFLPPNRFGRPLVCSTWFTRDTPTTIEWHTAAAATATATHKSKQTAIEQAHTRTRHKTIVTPWPQYSQQFQQLRSDHKIVYMVGIVRLLGCPVQWPPLPSHIHVVRTMRPKVFMRFCHCLAASK